MIPLVIDIKVNIMIIVTIDIIISIMIDNASMRAIILQSITHLKYYITHYTLHITHYTLHIHRWRYYISSNTDNFINKCHAVVPWCYGVMCHVMWYAKCTHISRNFMRHSHSVIVI